ncbi:hypothetical protein GBAR_LOCUS27412 [Geodia barretti]|uniref:Uncharacterized protein n=1 Tax=Geodia barretti TaxID=519541 RepID=A0AA35TML1_GEOBA|nr:hypothetical protein GBAR_LOCUS27412 [Geodia barretti]
MMSLYICQTCSKTTVEMRKITTVRMMRWTMERAGKLKVWVYLYIHNDSHLSSCLPLDTDEDDDSSDDDDEETETEEGVGPAIFVEKTTSFGGVVTLEEDETDHDDILQCWEDMLESAVQQCNYEMDRHCPGPPRRRN